jgi:membrane-associated phospholipid phosphatase
VKVVTFRNWALISASCAVLVLLAIFFVDRPVAEFAQTLPWARALRNPSLGIPVVVSLAAIAVVACGAYVLSGRPLAHWATTAALAALSVGWSEFLTEIILKPIFGRTHPDLLFTQKQFHFTWLQGDMNTSFPSGHAAQIASIAVVLWLLYPRWRALYATVVAAVMLALVLGSWHFVSDVIAGTFVGASSGLLIVSLWRQGTSTTYTK